MERATPILFIGLLLGLVGVSCRHEVIGPEPLPSAAEPEPETFWATRLDALEQLLRDEDAANR